MLADGGANPFKVSASTALQMNGVIPKREKDTLGAGVFFVGLSDDFKDTVGPLLSIASGTPTSVQSTKGMEAYYMAQLTPWFALTGNLQVISANLSTEDTKVVTGVRAKLTF